MARRLRWQLYPSYLLIIILTVVALAWWAIQAQDEFYLQQTAGNLTARARLVETQLRPYLERKQYEEVQTLTRLFGERTDTRITVILADGEVVGDSQHDPGHMENHALRPEIAAAMAAGLGQATRYSNTLQKRMMYVAVGSEAGGRTVGVVRTSLSISYIDEARSSLRLRMILGGLAIALIAALVSFGAALRISRPLEALRRGVERFAAGDLESKLPVPSSEEIGGLAQAMNDMAAQLYRRINTITKQRREQEAILTSMVEGVLAVDRDERVININRAAARLIGIDIEATMGQSVQAVVRNSKLHAIVGRTLRELQTVQDEITLSNDSDRLVEVSASVLRDAAGQGIGAVLVLNDVTRLRRLENVRREFVANVSHELKTPITSIVGSVETLLDGAMNDPEDARNFLEMTARQADRLHHIVEDLLSLSRIESEHNQGEITVEETTLAEVCQAAIGSCRPQADQKKIHIEFDGPTNLQLKVNSQLLEQAVVNLIDNAVKYSDPGTPVRVVLSEAEDEIVIDVIDRGQGIEAKHHERLFERFYRVDQARSRALGGTGLGLAIVKHIALAHGGSVSVSSNPGEGSTFSIRLPRSG
ncbi:MAG: ATP-binding protein [bacterium]